MPRPPQRVCLQDGLKPDLNRFFRQRTVRPDNYTGEVVASGQITSNLCNRDEGWLRFEADGFDQLPLVQTNFVASRHGDGGVLPIGRNSSGPMIARTTVRPRSSRTSSATAILMNGTCRRTRNG
jgi:hypothetical protein